MAERNPEKGLLAMVKDDFKVGRSAVSLEKNKLHQVAQQALNIEDLLHVIRASLSVMHEQWADAINIFHEKFDFLSDLVTDHGKCLLGGARTSPVVHQFLVNSLGEVGMKCVPKIVCGAGKELQLVVLNHLQDPILNLETEDEKLCSIPHAVVPPLSVSASRGVACVLAARKQALICILDEYEEESLIQNDCLFKSL